MYTYVRSSLLFPYFLPTSCYIFLCFLLYSLYTYLVCITRNRYHRKTTCKYRTGTAPSTSVISPSAHPFTIESVVRLLHFWILRYFLYRPHLRALLYTGELLRRPNTNVQVVSPRAQTGGQTVLTQMFIVATQSCIYRHFFLRMILSHQVGGLPVPWPWCSLKEVKMHTLACGYAQCICTV